ncbi:HEAT repeat domain-containing protein [Opitutus terrae]|uniref:Coagulation factor 5/8 type domain protein n=1 Tax=Opitutus terrae (strain DSM 11246 / JCM 15787 / PB90-1) TaxID=452637 RepID=B1ZVB8_OPITP|nr:HEAT repeat domain-containing protein [Opitutus terrae]ACB76785.1 coagulation factor 5/8 type domain protein [Opitutus terrae PB90-1]
MFSSRSSFLALGLAFALAGCSTRTTTPAPLAALDYAGDQQALVALDQEIAAAGQDAAKLSALAARLVRTLGDAQATFAARQAAAQRLALFPASVLTSSEHAPVFTALLADAKNYHLARLALDLVPGDSIDALYLHAFETAPAPAQLGLVQSLGNRRTASAVPLLSRLLDASDSALANAAAKALGQIGTSDALTALQHAPNPAAPELIAARLAAIDRIGGEAAAREARAISTNLGVPAHLRAAALRTLLFAEPQTAPERFVNAISSGDAEVQPVVIEAIATHPSPALVDALTARLASWNPITQSAVITALARRGDAAAVAAISTATQSSDPIVRTAAIEALGQLPGSPDTAVLLARLATGDCVDEAKLARQSLARLNGPGVADAVLGGAREGEPALREVFLDQIAARNMTAAVPLLLGTRSDPNPKLRAAALGSLAELAPASEQPAILDWAVAATDSSEQSRALRALANVTLRNPDVAGRARPVIAAIEKAPAEIAARLVPVLPRIGGADSAKCAAQLALRDQPALATAAATTLSRWTDASGLPHLVTVAEKSPLEETRRGAVRGAVTYLNRSRSLSSDELSAFVARLLAVAKDDATRANLVYLLTRCRDDAALALAEKLKAEPAIAETANDAVLAIRANRAGAPVLTATANQDDVARLVDGKPNTRWAAQSKLGQSVQVDFHSTRPVRQVVLDGAGNQWGYPDQVEIIVTDDPQHPTPAVATAAGEPGKTTINLPAGTRGRYLIVRHSTDKPDGWWSMAELLID